MLGNHRLLSLHLGQLVSEGQPRAGAEGASEAWAGLASVWS